MSKTKVKKDSKRLKNIKEYINSFFPEYSDKILLADGFEDSFLGVITNENGFPVAVYDRNKMILTLAKDMSYEDAEDYWCYNVENAYMGDFTPKYMQVYV